ncbi:hypothetical protein ACWEQC_32695 [Streptomyces shenzhenensis]
MSDRDDEVMGELTHAISAVYTMLVDVCGMLPVPIGLPTDPHIPVTVAYPAIQRAAEVAGDQPMGDLQTVQLYTGCIYLLAAIDLFALCEARYMDTRAEGCSANLLHAEKALSTLGTWLAINSAD